MQNPAAFCAAAFEARRSGDFLRSYDLASCGLEQFPADGNLAYVAVLALADLGNVELALEQYERFSKIGADECEDWLALRGRLFKELAHRAGDALRSTSEHYRRAAQAYESAFDATGKSYSGINAATMWLLQGDGERARQLAAQVLRTLTTEQPVSETGCYFHHATHAEAALISGDVDGVRVALLEAANFLVRDATARGRTLRQLRLICRQQGKDEAALSDLRVPDFACILPTRCAADGDARLLHQGNMAAVFMVPAERSEIMLAERFKADGVPLHLVLPFSRDEASAVLARRLDAHWCERIARLISEAQDVSIVSGFIEGEEQRAVDYARQIAVGLSRLRARQSGADWRALCSTEESAAPLQTAAAPRLDDGAVTWPCLMGAGQTQLQRRHAALIFADMTGFSRLQDNELPAYWNKVMPEVARVLARYSPHVLLQSTWGDALYLVVDTAQPAAAVALEIGATVTRLRSGLPGALASINLRLSIHYAPVYMGWDPVTLGRIYYGSHVSLAARIEPVTPPGDIYVSEALAAQLFLEGAEGFDLTYAGEVELAKRFGKHRMFNLRSLDAHRTVVPTAAASHKPSLIVGCTGALILSSEQRVWVHEQLVRRVLPTLVEHANNLRVKLMMGLAPGADLLFAETALEWLSARGLPYEMESLLPVPPETILADWNEKISAVGGQEIESVTRTGWGSMRRVLDCSFSVINLWSAETDIVDFAIKSFRQRQYRRLGSYLVRNCDVLVAIYDRGAGGDIGGAAEVVRWWRDPTQIPAPLVLGPQQGGARGLVVLDPEKREVVIELQ